jgi:hypothetical protein
MINAQKINTFFAGVSFGAAIWAAYDGAAWATLFNATCCGLNLWLSSKP